MIFIKCRSCLSLTPPKHAGLCLLVYSLTCSQFCCSTQRTLHQTQPRYKYLFQELAVLCVLETPAMKMECLAAEGVLSLVAHRVPCHPGSPPSSFQSHHPPACVCAVECTQWVWRNCLRALPGLPSVRSICLKPTHTQWSAPQQCSRSRA